jgi:hypothetical protein
MSDVAAVIPFVANRVERARKRLELAEELARQGIDAGPIPRDVERLAALDELAAGTEGAFSAFNARPCDVGDNDDGA